MACCYRFDTDVLVANLFESSRYPVRYSYDDIHKYFRYLSEKFPIYLTTNLSEHALYVCASEFEELYTVYKGKDGNVYLESKNYKPNKDYFNCLYQSGVRSYLESLTKEYVDSLEV